MLEMNKVLLIGNLTRDPELSYTAGGTALAKMGLAVNRSWKDRASGKYEKETTFVDIDAWAATAEFCAKYLKKGKRIFVEGRLRFSSWEASDGTKRSKLSVTADRVQFADAAPSAGGESASESESGGMEEPYALSSGGGAGSRPAAQSSASAASFPQSGNPPVGMDEPGSPPENTADDLPF